MIATKKILLGKEVIKLKRRIFWVKFAQVFVLVLAFLAVAWLFFSEVKVEEGNFWSALTRENIWKFFLFLLDISFTYLFGGKYLNNKIRDLRYDLSIYLAKPQMTKNASSY